MKISTDTKMTAALILAMNSRNMQGAEIHNSEAIADRALDLALTLEGRVAAKEEREDTERAELKTEIDHLEAQLGEVSAERDQLKANLAKALDQVKALTPAPVEVAPATEIAPVKA